ncbi:MAG: SPOR domain-containing protein [Gammaproteobacteria bacterium]
MVGAAVLVLLFVVFAPMLLDGRDDDSDSGKSATARDKKTKVIVLNQPVDKTSSPVSDKSDVATKADVSPVPDKPRAKPTAEAPRKGFAVQLGSFTSRDNAVGFAGSLQGAGYEVFVIRGSSSSGAVYRVYAGPRDSREAADELAVRLAREGQSVMVVDLSGSDGTG